MGRGHHLKHFGGLARWGRVLSLPSPAECPQRSPWGMIRNTGPQDHSNSNDGKGQGKRDSGGNKGSADEKNGDGRRNGSESGGGKDGNKKKS